MTTTAGKLEKSQTFTETFLSCLTAAQCDLHSYITYLVGNREEARDVLQETNIVLCREASRYDESKPFLPWAKAVAYYQALSHIKKRSKDRLVFDEDLVLLLATFDERRQNNEMVERLRELDNCFEKLTAFQQSVIKFRYFHGWPIRRLAKKFSFSEAAVSMLLTRIRRQLAQCIQAALQRESET